MMVFGGRREGCNSPVLVTRSNVLRASLLARLILDRRAVIHHTYMTTNGVIETVSYANPLLQQIVVAGYAYPADCAATMYVLRGCLNNSSTLAVAAANQHIDIEGIDYMIEQIHEHARDRIGSREDFN